MVRHLTALGIGLLCISASYSRVLAGCVELTPHRPTRKAEQQRWPVLPSVDRQQAEVAPKAPRMDWGTKLGSDWFAYRQARSC